jgi:hypothetical protein
MPRSGATPAKTVVLADEDPSGSSGETPTEAVADATGRLEDGPGGAAITPPYNPASPPNPEDDPEPAPAIHRFSPDELEKLGRRIWNSECGGTVEGLTSWNQGEAFASLGIGHFLWFPEGSGAIFEESFPDLLDFALEKGAHTEIPKWIRDGGRSGSWPACPWPYRESFLAEFNSGRMRELRSFLQSTVPLQTEFLLARFDAAFLKVLASAGSSERQVGRSFSLLSGTPEGAFAMIDYVNFKGEGTNEAERYQGEGWGLLQVLQTMGAAEGTGDSPVHAFSKAADQVLTRRTENNPSDAKWLAGWRSRVADYRKAF